MAATAISDTLAEVRDFLLEKRARFWSDPELRAIYGHGVSDLWGAILDVHGEHYMTIAPAQGGTDNGPVLRASAMQIDNVPDNCFRVLLIEPRDTSSDGTARQILFTPKKFNHPDFVVARTQSARDAGSTREIYYHVSGVGAPISAPTILTAPMVASDVLLRIAYCPTITLGDENPIPGESDNALKAWVIAYALAKEGPQGSRVPDPSWLGIYSTEKQLILTRLTPRQEQESEVVEDFYQGYQGN